MRELSRRRGVGVGYGAGAGALEQSPAHAPREPPALRPAARGGVAIHEYQPAMMHAKILIVDHVWSVVGSTNFDNRSFGLNDEVNVAILQKTLAARLEADFAADLAERRGHAGAVAPPRARRARVRQLARLLER